ncbi:MAG: NrsF family protein [Methylobacterium frigidaeris]
MSELRRHAPLLDALAGDLAPVRPLAPPLVRALAWFAAVLGLALVLLLAAADLADLRQRMAQPVVLVAALGAGATALAAALAACLSGVPGRSRFWALLPLPPALVWIGASGVGCLSPSPPGAADQTGGCAVTIMALSLPLSLLAVLMLRRTCPLRPALTAGLGGLAAAAGAAALLALVHPHAATAADLAIHVVAVALVVLANLVAGGRLLGPASCSGPGGRADRR